MKCIRSTKVSTYKQLNTSYGGLVLILDQYVFLLERKGSSFKGLILLIIQKAAGLFSSVHFLDMDLTWNRLSHYFEPLSKSKFEFEFLLQGWSPKFLVRRAALKFQSVD